MISPSGTSVSPHEFRFDFGTTWLDFLATLRRPLAADRLERLSRPERLDEWLARVGMAPLTSSSDADLEAARELREGIRALCLDAIADAPTDPRALGLLNRWLRVGAGSLRAEPRSGGTGIGLEAPAHASQALARLARQAATDLGGRAAVHLRACEAADCGAVFLDLTGRRRWCSTTLCGNRERVRAHRLRRRES